MVYFFCVIRAHSFSLPPHVLLHHSPRQSHTLSTIILIPTHHLHPIPILSLHTYLTRLRPHTLVCFGGLFFFLLYPSMSAPHTNTYDFILCLSYAVGFFGVGFFLRPFVRSCCSNIIFPVRRLKYTGSVLAFSSALSPVFCILLPFHFCHAYSIHVLSTRVLHTPHISAQPSINRMASSVYDVSESRRIDELMDRTFNCFQLCRMNHARRHAHLMDSCRKAWPVWVITLKC